MKLIAIAAVLALVAGGVDVEAQNIGDQGGSRDHRTHCCLAALRWESHQMLKKSKKRHQERKREVHNTQFGVVH